MGLFEQTELLQHRHIVPNCRGGDIDIGQRGNGLGADGLAGRDIRIHNCRKDPQFSVIHLPNAPFIWFLQTGFICASTLSLRVLSIRYHFSARMSSLPTEFSQTSSDCTSFPQIRNQKCEMRNCNIRYELEMRNEE